MENYEVMTPEKESEILGYIVDMIKDDFDREQFATAEQELRENGFLEAAGYTYEEMWNLLEDCGLDMDAILDRVDDYGMGMRETTLCALDIIIDGNLFADNGETTPTVKPEPEVTATPIPTAAPEPEATATPVPTATPTPEDSQSGEDGGSASGSDTGNNGGNDGTVVDAEGNVVRPGGGYVQGGNPAQDGTLDSELNDGGNTETGGQDVTSGDEATEIEDGEVVLGDIDKLVTDILGESGLTGDELIEIVEEEVPLVSDPGMATNAGSGDGMKKGWMLWWFFLLLLLIAILVGRTAYKKLESKAQEADE